MSTNETGKSRGSNSGESRASELPSPLADASELCRFNADQLTKLYQSHKLSPLDVTIEVLKRAEAINSKYNAFLLIDHDKALAAARESEARWRANTPCGILDGIPVTIKDLVSVRGWPLRMGSATTSDKPIEKDAPTVESLRAAGAIFIGSTSTCEFGWKGVTDCPNTGATGNPWNDALTSGGSSGGAAVAAATGCGVLHLGSDGAGSIRIPAAFCGTVGHKPTFGRVPYFPPSAFGAVGHLGPITRSAEDAAKMLQVLSTRDNRDWNQNCLSFLAVSPLRNYNWKGARIGLWIEPPVGTVDPQIMSATLAAAREIEKWGAIVETVTLPGNNLLEQINTFWFSGAANRLKKIPASLIDKVDPGLRRIAEIGNSYTAVDYVSAATERAIFGGEMDSLLERYDLLISPSTPVLAFPINHNVPPDSGQHVWTEWAAFNFPLNLSQQPACSIPIGLSQSGLPIGLQLVGPRGRDDLVLDASASFMKQRPTWWRPAGSATGAE